MKLVCGSVRAGRRNAKSEWWKNEVQALVESKDVFNRKRKREGLKGVYIIMKYYSYTRSLDGS